LVLLGAVVFVLLIACANVANLVLAKNSRAKEGNRDRTSLGASRAAVLRQILAETLLLSLARRRARAFPGPALHYVDQKFLADRLPSSRKIALDASVLAFTVFLALLAGILAGLLPAVRFTRTDVNEALKEGRGSSIPVEADARLLVSRRCLVVVLLIGPA